MKPILSIQEIRKEFGSKTVVDNISFEVYTGEILGILGPNGAGKSTTIRSIMGIILPDSGNVEFNFQNNSKKILSNIGYLPEERGLYKDIKIMDMLLYLAKLKNYPKAKAKIRAMEYLEKFNLKGKEGVKIQELSKGMAQKVQFISAILHEPEILILDEPFSGLDPISQDVFSKEIKIIAENGTAVLLSSHQMNIVENICDRIFMIYNGKRVLYDSLSEIKKNFANFKCDIVGENTEIDFSLINEVERVVKNGSHTILHLTKDTNPNQFIQTLPKEIDIQEITINRSSLHDIFVNVANSSKSEHSSLFEIEHITQEN